MSTTGSTSTNNDENGFKEFLRMLRSINFTSPMNRARRTISEADTLIYRTNGDTSKLREKVGELKRIVRDVMTMTNGKPSPSHVQAIDLAIAEIRDAIKELSMSPISSPTRNSNVVENGTVSTEDDTEIDLFEEDSEDIELSSDEASDENLNSELSSDIQLQQDPNAIITNEIVATDDGFFNIVEETIISEINNKIESEQDVLLNALFKKVIDANGKVTFVLNKDMHEVSQYIHTIVKNMETKKATNAVINGTPIDDTPITIETFINDYFGDNISDKLKHLVDSSILYQRTLNSMFEISEVGGVSDDTRIIAKRIVSSMGRISNFTTNVMEDFISKMNLFTDLIALKKSITGLAFPHISVKDCIRLIKEAYVLESPEISDEQLLHLSKNLPSILSNISEHLGASRKMLMDKFVEDMVNTFSEDGTLGKSVLDGSLDYNEGTIKIINNNGEEQTLNIMDAVTTEDPLYTYDKLYKSIYFINCI